MLLPCSECQLNLHPSKYFSEGDPKRFRALIVLTDGCDSDTFLGDSQVEFAGKAFRHQHTSFGRGEIASRGLHNWSFI